MPWPPPNTPAIVAEALASVTHPVRTALVPGPRGAAPDVARALAAAVAPAGASDAPPPWLFPSQRRAYARTLAALRQYRGALLAEPTGSGKTYIALAVAWRWQRTAVACVVPAGLTAKWSAAAAGLGIPIVVASHEQVSRGRLPPGTRGLVLIDESHHLRHPGILRYARLADFLVGRPALLISATPVVNSTADLAHQLRLAVRDDALAAEGLASLAGGLTSAASALGSVVIATHAAGNGLPLRASQALRPPMAGTGPALLHQIDQLRLSADAGVARLIRGVLWRAMASSPAALLGAVQRYQSLLAHAADARAGGRMPSRQRLREWVGGVTEQLVIWELMTDADAGDSDLVLEDAPALHTLIDAVRAAAGARDPKLDQLHTLLADGRTTLIFCASRETVDYLRRRLARPIGWCTGEAAGIDGARVTRAALFAAFGQCTGPRALVASDVAAEGLDLQAAERVVHYDLPWTATRLEQREGRAARLGSRYAVIAIARFEPPPALERRLRQWEILTRSAQAPARVGIGDGRGAEAVWQWRDLLARRLGDGPVCHGVSAVESSHRGALAGIAFEDERTDHRIAAALLWVGNDGESRSDPAWLMARLDEAASAASDCRPPADFDAALAVALDALARPVARLLRRVQQARWNCPPRSPGAGAVIRRLAHQSRDAARRRDLPTLAVLERALAIASGGLTAGEARILERLAAEPHAGRGDTWGPLLRLPARAPRPGAVSVRLTGVILFGPP